MARIVFQDGTSTSREPHEVDPHQAIPEGAVLVDHGRSMTDNLPRDLVKAPLGVEFTMPEGVEIVEPADTEKVEQSRKATEGSTASRARTPGSPRRTQAASGGGSGRSTSREGTRAGPTQEIPSDKLKEPATAGPKAEEHDERPSGLILPHAAPHSTTDTSGSVPQGRISLGEDHDAQRRDQGRDQHPDHDSDE